MLVRDVEKFEKDFALEVLELVDSLGFKGPMKGPQRIVQEGCLPFDPTAATPNAVGAVRHCTVLRCVVLYCIVETVVSYL